MWVMTIRANGTNNDANYNSTNANASVLRIAIAEKHCDLVHTIYAQF